MSMIVTRPLPTRRAGLAAAAPRTARNLRFPIGMALVIPLTTKDRGLPHHVPIRSPEAGLKQPSWARTEDIRAVSTGRFTRPAPLGRLSDSEIQQVRVWVHRMLS